MTVAERPALRSMRSPELLVNDFDPPALELSIVVLALYVTQHVLEAMRLTGTPRILYASGSGVYGDLGEAEAREDP